MDRATEYARRVVGGEVACGELHRLACKRHLDDLARQGTEGFPFTWDADASERVLDYAETLTLSEGFDKRRLKLLDHQAFDIGCTFGWKRADGYRRFRRRYKSVARQEGKSIENGILGTYIAGFGGYRLGKLFTAATKKRQAKIVWEEMAKFIRADKNLAEFFTVTEYKNLITAKGSGCTIEALSKEAGLDDGFRPIFASLDELHQMKDNSVYKALLNGTRKLPETLISMITTRGFNLNSFAYEMDTYAANVLRGVTTADDFFADIYALDEGDDPYDEAVWVKSNPLQAMTERGMEQLRTEAATARAMGGQEARDFMTKCMNMWVTETDSTFISREDLEAARGDMELEDFRGARCWAGVDLSSGGDLTTVALEFEFDGGGAYFWTQSFMPRGRLADHIITDTAPYDVWARDGLIRATGDTTDYRNDYKFIVAELRRVVDEYGLEIQGIGYDPHNAATFTEDLEEFGAPVVKVVQSCKSLNDATVDVQLLARSGKLQVARSNELMAWSITNAKLVFNSFGECKVDKNYGRFGRIDPVDACIDAHYVRMAQVESEPVDVNEEMERYLQMMGWG